MLVLGLLSAPQSKGGGGALLCLGALHDRLHKKAEYADKLEGMLYMHVLPELQSKAGFMRARAVWVFGQFAKSVFANGGATQPAQFQEVFNRAMALLADPELPVRVQVRARAPVPRAVVDTRALQPRSPRESRERICVMCPFPRPPPPRRPSR